ncbi:MAG: proton-conducting transporter membrane subunit [Nocardioides sp.]
MPWYRASRTLTLAAVLVGVAALPAALAGEPWTWMASPVGIAIGVRLDLVAALLTAFVGLLGWVVATYSVTNLRGRARRSEIGAALFAAIAALLLTVSGGSLVSIGVGWTLSGLAVAALVSRAGGHDATRSAALLRRHLLIGDGFLWAGITVAALTLPTLERARLDELDAGTSTTLVALLLLGAAVARSGLVPSHRWLPETAEAPSPVSALLHAGVVNGAGVLVLLTWPLYAAAPAALLALAVLGAASVVVGIWAGQARSDVKGRLACSTTSQMGYMSLQLGLGLPAAALMHLLGHGAYKSWLFLRAGGAVGRARTLVLPQPLTSARQHGPALLAVAVAGLLIIGGLAAERRRRG